MRDLRAAAIVVAMLAACTPFGASVPRDAEDAGPGSASGDGAASNATSSSIRFVQAQSTTTTGSTATVTLPNVTAHDAIILAISFVIATSSPALVSVKDDGNDVFTTPVGPVDRAALIRSLLAVALDVSGTPGARAITVTLDQPTTINLIAHEYANIALSGALDQGGTATGSSSLRDGMQSPPVVITAPNELVFGYGETDITVAGTGFTERSNAYNCITEDKISAPPGRYTATATMAGGMSWAMLIASFKGR
jgi:hypothetical protein